LRPDPTGTAASFMAGNKEIGPFSLEHFQVRWIRLTAENAAN
jgi:hypothetical protein